ncbi:MAG: radical SAM protein [Chloroflexi bacterium]|nr:radical SAM protein [Chloroflexota bacterium]
MWHRKQGRVYEWHRKASLALKWLHYSLGRTRNLPNPDRMYLESTNVCNLSCVMCPSGRNLMSRPKGFMSFDLFRSIVDEMARRVQVTTLHIWGEPLLHPQIFDMIAYCRKAGLHSEISTNATLLDRQRGRALISAGVGTVYLCLDGVQKQTYEMIRQGADFEQTRSNIAAFLDLKNSVGRETPYVNLQIIEMRPTMAEIDEFHKQWRLPGVDHINVKAFDSWGNQVEQITGLGANGHLTPARRFRCPNLWYHVHIYWDGMLVSCDRDFDATYPLGNVSSGVMKAWNGERMALLRRKHVLSQLADVPACSNCVEWSWWKPGIFMAHGNAPAENDGQKTRDAR